MATGSKKIVFALGLDTKEFQAKLRSLDKEVRSSAKELNQINRLLKLDPKNANLLAQKAELLNKSLKANAEKAQTLKAALNELEAKGVSRTSQEFRDLERQLIKVTSDSDKLKDTLAKMKLNSKLTDSLDKLGDKFKTLGEKTKTLSKVSAVALGGIAASAVHAGKKADEINTLSKVTGIGVEKLQRYAFASELVDVSVEDVAQSMRKLTQNMSKAQQGTKRAQEAFSRLGVSYEDSNGKLKNADSLFSEIINKLHNIDNVTERDAIAMELFGRNAQNLNPLIMEGAQAFDEYAKSAQGILTPEQLDKANQFNDSLDLIKAQAKQTALSLGAMFADDFRAGAEMAQQAFQGIAAKVAELPQGVRQFVVAGAAMGAAVSPVLTGIGSGFRTLSDTIRGIKDASSIARSALQGLGAAKSWLATLISTGGTLTTVFTTLGTAGSAMWAAITGPIGITVAAIAAVGAGLYALYTKCEWFRNAVDRIISAVGSMFKGLVNIVSSVVNTIGKVFSTVSSWIGGAIDGVKSFFTGSKSTGKKTNKASNYASGRSSTPSSPHYGANPPKLAVGTDYVEKSGLAVIHRGEAVVTSDNNKMFSEIAKNLKDGQHITASLTVNLDGRTIAKQVHELVGEYQANSMRRARA